MAPTAGAMFAASHLPTGPVLGAPAGPARLVFVGWAVSMGLLGLHDVIVTKDWPCPGRYIRASAAYLLLGLLSEFAPSLAGTMAVGLTIALLVRQASLEVDQRGTFFGVRVR